MILAPRVESFLPSTHLSDNYIEKRKLESSKTMTEIILNGLMRLVG